MEIIFKNEETTVTAHCMYRDCTNINLQQKSAKAIHIFHMQTKC